MQPRSFLLVSFGELHFFRAASDCNRIISGTFHHPLGLLFSVPSRYYFAIGLEVYLGLDVNSPIFAPPIQGALLFAEPPFFRTHTGLSPCNTLHSRRLLIRKRRMLSRTTSPTHFCADSVCPMRLSLAVTHRIPVGFFSSGY